VRILLVHPGATFSVQDVYDGWLEALQGLGHTVAEYNLGDRLIFYGSVHLQAEDGTWHEALDKRAAQLHAVNGLYASLMRVRPDVMIVVSAFFIPLDLFDIARQFGVRVVVHHTESPYQDDQQIQVAAHADLNLLNDPLNVEKFRRVAPAEYMWHAYRPTVHCPGPSLADLECDFAFVGTGYPSRVEFLERMNLGGLRVTLAGNWQHAESLHRFVPHDLGDCYDNAQTIQLYRSTRASLNLYRREREGGGPAEAGWSMGPREVELAATGTFFLRDSRPEGDEVLDMLPVFTSPEDASEQLRWWLDHDSQREAAADKARSAIADRTFHNNARRLMRLLKEE